MTASAVYDRRPARVRAIRFDAETDPQVYAGLMPEGWTAVGYDIQGRTILKIHSPENREGERRSFICNDGDWIVLEGGRPWRWPAVLFRSLHRMAEEVAGQDAPPDPYNR